MAISKKTRKILWAKSGNYCAICKKPLIAEPNIEDRHSVVSDECHIVAQSRSGPRFDEQFPSEQIDEYYANPPDSTEPPGIMAFVAA